MHKQETLKGKIVHLIEYAKHSKEEDLDNVVKVFVNFVREQRIKILKETLQLLEKEDYEAIIEERQRQEATKLSERKDL